MHVQTDEQNASLAGNRWQARGEDGDGVAAISGSVRAARGLICGSMASGSRSM